MRPHMRIVLTNDDGFDAPGLAALATAVGSLGGEIVVVAPLEPHSGCGHRVTTDRPLRVEETGPGRFAVAGTPADCVRLALATIAPDAALVIAGINAGGNLGVDVHHSGTVAAAREAALHGRRAVAASHYHRRGTVIDWGRAARWLEAVFARLPLDATSAGEFWNVNLPDLPAAAAAPAVVECALDASPFTLAYRATDAGWHFDCRYHERPRAAGGDVDVCFSGAIAVSRLRA
ncbi:MAG: 5'/3'-nucleotidase SurE [Planctomycetaceae bacterium]